MASVNYKVAGFSPNVKNDLGVIQRNDFRRDGAYSKDGVTPSRFSYNFDGTNDYGVLANRAINPDLDIDIEWHQRQLQSGNKAVINQCDSATGSSRELNLRILSGNLELVVGGATVLAVADAVAQAIGLWRIFYSGTTIQVFFNGALIRTLTSRTRGAAREPAAPTRICARNNGGSFVEFAQGIFYNIRINGVSWQMAVRNSATQVSTPAGNTMTLVNTADSRWQEIIE